MIFLELFWAFFQIGFLAFGGGYGALSLIQDQIVNVNKWLELPEFLDLISISQMTPGPIAINSATFIGYRIAGLGGSIISTIG
nr:chromate transporter [Mesotoga sp.]